MRFARRALLAAGHLRAQGSAQGRRTLFAVAAEPPISPDKLQQMEREYTSLLGDLRRLRKEVSVHELKNEIRYFASMERYRLRLDEVAELCSKKNYRTSPFLRSELPKRIAGHVEELSRLPNGLYHMPSVQAVRNQYIQSFLEVLAFPKFVDEKNPTEEEEERFTKLIKKLEHRHEDTMQLLAQGVHEFKEELRGIAVHTRLGRQSDSEVFIADHPDVQTSLDTFYSHRISTAFLVKQHLALREPSDDPTVVGLIHTKMSLYQVAQDACGTAKNLCELSYGDAPDVEIRGGTHTFSHVPSHIWYVLVELLKNSMRAVAEKYQGKPMPPVVLTITDGCTTEDVTLRISDQGGGIKRSHLKYIWSYMYTTAKSMFPSGQAAPSEDVQSAIPPLAGFGYGLPISRLYAQHFGGDLQLVSMEGYGTDAYLHLGQLGARLERALGSAHDTPWRFRPGEYK
eukprot:TRINITY_DN6395_c0_g1_i1.p2 TRINITY_DN6395_c0_g1~~TRINITY_DN6395_c0_g1_i1.p2  ORF type:complete len:462 (+),score=104.90 TRINITY_DN6395_c0_g1_i1:23-1387(+)